MGEQRSETVGVGAREWRRDGNLIYTLDQTGWRKGEPVMQNRIWIQVQSNHDVPAEEVSSVADHIVAALSHSDVTPPDLASLPSEAEANTEDLKARIAELEVERVMGFHEKHAVLHNRATTAEASLAVAVKVLEDIRCRVVHGHPTPREYLLEMTKCVDPPVDSADLSAIKEGRPSEGDKLVARLTEMAGLMGVRFVPDPEKVAALNAASPLPLPDAKEGERAGVPNAHGILPCRCGFYPRPKGDGARPDDGYRSLWCDECREHVTSWHSSRQEAIDHWNEERELATGSTAWNSSIQEEESARAALSTGTPSVKSCDCDRGQSEHGIAGWECDCKPPTGTPADTVNGTKAKLPVSNGEGGLYGPLGYLVGERDLNEEHWRLETDPEHDPDCFSIALYSVTPPPIVADSAATPTGPIRRPDWLSLYGYHPRGGVDDPQQLVVVTRHTLQLGLSAIEASQKREAYHNFIAAQKEIMDVLDIITKPSDDGRDRDGEGA